MQSTINKSGRHAFAILSFARSRDVWAGGGALFFAACSALPQPASTVFLGKFSNTVAQFGTGLIDSTQLRQQSLTAVYGFVGVGCCTLIVDACMFSMWAIFGDLQARHAREDLFRGLVQKDIEWFETKESGVAPLLTRLQTYNTSLLSTCTRMLIIISQIRDLQQSTSLSLGLVIQGAVRGCAAFGLAMCYSWKLTLVILTVVPVSTATLCVITRGFQNHISYQNHFLTQASKIAFNAISNITTVKCFSTEQRETARYVAAIDDAAGHSLRQARISALQSGTVGFLVFSMFTLGAFLVVQAPASVC